MLLSPSTIATHPSDQSFPETPQTQSAPAESHSASHNQGHKHQWHNLSPVRTDLEEEGEGKGEDSQAESEEEAIAMVPHVGSADPRPKVDVRTWKDL